jgi:hypothetical protein
VSGTRPGLLRLIADTAGDWIYAILISLGWQPRTEREKPQEEPPSRM